MGGKMGGKLSNISRILHFDKNDNIPEIEKDSKLLELRMTIGLIRYGILRLTISETT